MGIAENDQLRTFSDVSPVNSLPPKCGKEQRRETRYMVSWRAAVSVDGQNFHYGRLKDISPHGTAILNDLNIKPGAHVTLKIHIPTIERPCKPKVLIVHGIAVYAIYDAERLCFRVGVSFVKSGQSSGCAYLEEHLTGRHIKVPDYVCRRSTDRMA